jgi:hypothetical protein
VSDLQDPENRQEGWPIVSLFEALSQVIESIYGPAVSVNSFIENCSYTLSLIPKLSRIFANAAARFKSK